MKNAENDSPMNRLGRGSDINTLLQLYITTKEKQYTDRFQEQIWSSLERSTSGRAANAGSISGRLLHTALIAILILICPL